MLLFLCLLAYVLVDKVTIEMFLGLHPQLFPGKDITSKTKLVRTKGFQRKEADEVQTLAKIKINGKEVDKDMNIEKCNKL